MLIENTTEGGKPTLRFGKRVYFNEILFDATFFQTYRWNAFHLFVNYHETYLIIKLHLGENSNSEEDPTVPA